MRKWAAQSGHPDRRSPEFGSRLLIVIQFLMGLDGEESSQEAQLMTTYTHLWARALLLLVVVAFWARLYGSTVT
jgi:hypothetical protein